MRCFFRLNPIGVALVAAALVFVATSSPAQAKHPKPFHISGTGIALTGLPLPGQPPRSLISSGTANHLGQHTGSGNMITTTAVPQLDGSFTGTFGSVDHFTFIGANGDKLVCRFGKAAPDEFVGTFVLSPDLDNPGIFTADLIADFVLCVRNVPASLKV